MAPSSCHTRGWICLNIVAVFFPPPLLTPLSPPLLRSKREQDRGRVLTASRAAPCRAKASVSVGKASVCVFARTVRRQATPDFFFFFESLFIVLPPLLLLLLFHAHGIHQATLLDRRPLASHFGSDSGVSPRSLPYFACDLIIFCAVEKRQRGEGEKKKKKGKTCRRQFIFPRGGGGGVFFFFFFVIITIVIYRGVV